MPEAEPQTMPEAEPETMPEAEPQTMNVLNAVPLIATASSKAIAFSLIMRMVRFPVLLCLGLARHGKGERNHLAG